MSKPKEEAMDVEEAELLNENIDNELVLQKYQSAAQIANETMSVLIKECVEGKSIFELCELGDKTIVEKVKTPFKKLKLAKGVAFPTCVSVNEIVSHFSPIFEEKLTIKNGDVVRIDLGVHIDGYISCCSHTFFVTKETDFKLVGKQGDAYACAIECLHVADKLLRPGVTNTQLSKSFATIADNFKVNLAEGVLSHQFKRFVIDGSNSIILKSSTEHQTEEFQFKEFEVYNIDIVIFNCTKFK